MLLQYLGLLILVAHSAARTYEGRHYQYTAINTKLDQFIGQLDDIAGDLRELNTAYRKLKEEGDEYNSDNSYEEGRLMPLLGSSDDSDSWADDIDRCKWAEFDVSRDYYHGQQTWTSKVYCDEVNHFLTAIEYSDQLGVVVGKCCEKKDKKRRNRG
ncbi:hypothetical protein ACHWQZ_G004871 [Mnemiopsis leidyi]